MRCVGTARSFDRDRGASSLRRHGEERSEVLALTTERAVARSLPNGYRRIR